MRIYQNQHRHSTYTNTRVSDSVVYNEDYAKRAVELGHGIITTMEHGYQGRYIEGYELAKKYNLKFVFGVEAYWVKNRFESDNSNCHICIYAKNENGRQEINDKLSEANISGFYGQPRLDLELILSLPKDDVIVTTACVGFWKYEDVDSIIEKLHSHFGKNLFLEIQYHNTEKQKNINLHIKYLASVHNIEMIMGCDSHYITDDTAWERDDYLKSKGLTYPEEVGWYLDYPDGDEAFNRFVVQGVFTEKEIEKAMSNTNVFLKVEEYDNPCFTKDVKMPILPENKGLSQEERDNKFNDLVWSLWKDEKSSIVNPLLEMGNEELTDYMILHEFNSTHVNLSKDELLDLTINEKVDIVVDHYEREISSEIDTVITAKHSDYFLMNYKIINESVKRGGMITNTGRGSAVSFFINKLLKFTKVDRIAAKVKMYPERFMSAIRILEAGTLADIDFNLGNPEVFHETQKDIIGNECAYPMIAYGKYKASSAFKMYAKAKDVPYETANDISAQIKKYESDYNQADDEDKEDIILWDYVDEKYHQVLEDSEKYLGIISSWSPHPCATVVYNGNIRREIGLVMMRSDNGKKLTLCSLMDGLWAEKYSFLKNDFLKVNVVKLIKLAYKDANIDEDDIFSLLKKTEYNDKVMDIYKNGFTIGVNQVEQIGSRNKVMRYMPKNITELTAFSAAIRPSFKSMFEIYVNRKHFDYGIKAFDDIIQTPEMTSSFILYQEMIMAALNYAGIPMSDCYTVIKCISKKRKQQIMEYKEVFVPNFTEKIMMTENKPEDEARELSNKVWGIIEDSAKYGFNASHAYCVALDGLYGAYLKAYKPLNFYKVYLNIMNEKGDKKKIASAISEMKKAFGIEVLPLKFRQDNRTFAIDENANSITGTLKSIKGIGDKLGSQLYEIRDIEVDSFVDLLIYMAENGLLNKNIRKLTSIGYFEEFGNTKKLLAIYDEFNEGKNKYDKKHKDNTKIKRTSWLKEYENDCVDEDLEPLDKLSAEINVYGEPRTKIKELKNYIYIKEVNTRYTPKLEVITVTQGITMFMKIDKKTYAKNPVGEDKVIKINSYDIRLDGKFNNGKWEEIPDTKVFWLLDYEEIKIEKEK